MFNNWEGFTLTSVRPSMSEAVDLLNQIEDQGYDPRFMFLTQQGVQVYGRKKEASLPPPSSLSELMLDSSKLCSQIKINPDPDFWKQEKQ